MLWLDEARTEAEAGGGAARAVLREADGRGGASEVPLGGLTGEALAAGAPRCWLAPRAHPRFAAESDLPAERAAGACEGSLWVLPFTGARGAVAGAVRVHARGEDGFAGAPAHLAATLQGLASLALAAALEAGAAPADPAVALLPAAGARLAADDDTPTDLLRDACARLASPRVHLHQLHIE